MREKKVLKKWMALALACALVISAMGFDRAINAQAEDEVIENLIVNGDFDAEDGMDAEGWTPGKQEIVKEPIIKDIMTNGGFDSTTPGFTNYASSNGSIAVVQEETNKVLRLTTNSTRTLTIGKYGFGVTPGTEYTVSFKVKIPNNGATEAKISAYTFQRNNSSSQIGNTSIGTGYIYASEDNGWQTKEFKFTAVDTAITCDLRFEMYAYQDASVDIDDIKITYISGEQNKTVVTEYIENGDFSKDDLKWSVASGEGDVTIDGEALKINRSGDNLWVKYNSDIPVTPNKQYTFSFSMRGDNVTRLYSYLYHKDVNGTNLNKSTSYVDNMQPQATSRIITYTYTPSEGVGRIEFRFNVGVSAGTVYVDNFSITSQEDVYGDGITLNGTDFEMQLSDGNSAIYSGAEFTTNAWYRYSYDVVADETLTKAGLKVGNDIKTATSGTFKYVDGQEIGFGTAGEGKAYFDNLIIQKISGTGELIANGSFDVTDETTTSGYADWNAGAEKIITQGNNLVPNGGFESATDGKPSNWNVSSFSGATVVDNESAEGSRALKLSWATGDGTKTVWMNAYGTLSKNTTYTITFQMKTSDSSVRMRPYLVIKPSIGNLPYIYLDTITSTAGTDWQKMTYSYTTPDDLLSTANYVLRFEMTTTPATVYIDDVQVYQTEIVTQNDPVVSETTAQGIAGVDLSGDQCYLETEVAETQAGVSYILAMNTAVQGSGSGKIDLINDGESETIGELTGATVTAQKYLVSSPEATSYKLRFKVDGQNTTLSLGDVSMYMNCGDFDWDNDVEEDDFDTMREALLGIADADALYFCDLTGDGVGTVTDLIRMKLYAVGIK